MSNKTRAILGLVCVLLGLFWNDIKERIPDFIPEPTPQVVINNPGDDIVDQVKPIADLVTDEDDRVKLAIFNDIFSQRCIAWKADAQQYNDIYSLAGKNVFGDSMRGKHEGYGEGLNELMKSTLGVENHEVTDKEKQKLSQDFQGLAYSLSQ
ncbi:MAG: hypothetical protein ACXADH_00870 [Candidatus Kariarchaeaceae archaeon]|jgi:hypothetical protein